MATAAYKQPNGLISLHSPSSGDVWAWNCTPESAWTFLVFFYGHNSPEGAAENIAGALNPAGRFGHPRGYDWEDCLEVVERSQGKERADQLRESCTKEVSGFPYSRPLFWTLRYGLMLGEVGTMDPDPEWGSHAEYLYDLPGKDEVDVLRQFHKMTGGIHLSQDPSKTAMVVER